MLDEVTGTKQSYHWVRDGKELTDSDLYLGTDSKILVIKRATSSVQGEYWCKVENECGDVCSNKAKVTVRK